jgi:hypothetical protein
MFQIPGLSLAPIAIRHQNLQVASLILAVAKLAVHGIHLQIQVLLLILAVAIPAAAGLLQIIKTISNKYF